MGRADGLCRGIRLVEDVRRPHAGVDSYAVSEIHSELTLLFRKEQEKNCLRLVDVLQEEPDAGQAQHEERPVHDPLVVLEPRGPRE